MTHLPIETFMCLRYDIEFRHLWCIQIYLYPAETVLSSDAMEKRVGNETSVSFSFSCRFRKGHLNMILLQPQLAAGFAWCWFPVTLSSPLVTPITTSSKNYRVVIPGLACGFHSAT